MASTRWPTSDKAKYLTKPGINRIDGPAKVKGEAKYAYDINRPQMLIAKILSSPHPNAAIRSIDTSAAEKMPGVRAISIMTGPGAAGVSAQRAKLTPQWDGFEVVAVAADTEELAKDAIRAIKVDYEIQPHHVDATNLDAAPAERKPNPATQLQGTEESLAAAFKSAATVVEGTYGIASVAHCCLEAHGQVAEWPAADRLKYDASTQSVTTFNGQVSQAFQMPAANIQVSCQYIGGGFGAKFTVDTWGLVCAELAKKAGRPVKLMLERDQELQIAGMRPSTFSRVKVACDADNNITAWESTTWGTSGMAGANSGANIPYVFVGIPNSKRTGQRIATNVGPSRAWRAPNHPQAAAVTMTAIEDLAAARKVDPLDFFIKNLALTARPNLTIDFPKVYREELLMGAEMIGWKKKWRPRGTSPGPVKRGLGLSLATWAGAGHASQCMCLVNSDGTIELRIGTQDLGTGTRTALTIVAAETFSVPLDLITVKIGENTYPASGSSGGSSTIGGISASSRRACTEALNQLLARVAPGLGVAADALEAADGFIRVAAEPGKRLAWKEAAAKIGPTPISVTADRDKPGDQAPLFTGNVGGINMAEVSVDTETGIVRVEEMIAVQDVGLVVSRKTCESQVYGAMIMGVCSALYEELIYDSQTGRLLNPNLEFYKLAGIGDIGRMRVHLMTGPGYDERGPVGVGEPAMNGPVAAIANAVANAVGVRVPVAPFTPDRVLAALQQGGRA
jgi:xanthine dehydrogenase YagR molybdenum-binding subunit